MAHGEICPICKGTGVVSGNTPDLTARYSITCHGCGGLGWITVTDVRTTAFFGARGRCRATGNTLFPGVPI